MCIRPYASSLEFVYIIRYIEKLIYEACTKKTQN